MSDMIRSRIPTRQIPLGNVVGESPEVQRIYQIVRRAARTTRPVLIVGEAGTGKEMIARTIHSTGPLRCMPFISLDCASLSSEALQGTISGCSYTPPSYGSEMIRNPATYDGTLFLDRIDDLHLDAQALLLRAIHDNEVWAIHDSLRLRRRLRILAATARDLKLAVAEGTFRRDLYFRLNVLSLRMPPLRERRRDIPLLVSSFLHQLSQSTGRQYRLSEAALKAMLVYDWPGNIRELESCVERACSSAMQPVIRLLDLPGLISGAQSFSFPNIRFVPLYELQKRSILETMLQVNGNRRIAAQLLGIGKTTLYRKLKEYGMRDRE